MKTAIATLFIPRAEGALVRYYPEDLPKMSRFSHPTILHYARRIGADFHILEKRRWPDVHFFFEKFQICELLKKGYDRVLYVDGDAVIRGDAPNIFDLVPPGRFAAVNEGRTWHDGGYRLVTDILGMFGGTPVGWVYDKVYMNAGIFVADPASIPFLTKPKRLQQQLLYYDQGMINQLQQERKLNYFELDKVWNFMPMAHPKLSIAEIAAQAYIVHASSFCLHRRFQILQEVLRIWAPTYRGDAHGR